MPFILQTSGLSKKIGSKALVTDVNIHIPKGEIYGFLGPNGAGKTTVMKMITNLWKPTSGTIEVFGEVLTPKSYEVLLQYILLPSILCCILASDYMHKSLKLQELHTHHPHPYTFFPAPYSYRFILLQILLNMFQTIDLVLYITGWYPTENHIIVLAC